MSATPASGPSEEASWLVTLTVGVRDERGTRPVANRAERRTDALTWTPDTRPSIRSPPSNPDVGSTRLLDSARVGDHLDLALPLRGRALSGSREDADYLVQETYARVLAKPRFLRRSEGDLGYLLVALRNTFFDRKRAERRRPRPAPLPDEAELVEERSWRDPEAAFATREVFAARERSPGRFPRRARRGRHHGPLLQGGSAVRYGFRRALVMSRLYRARRQVLRILGD